MLTNPPIPYEVVAPFNQEKALVGAFSVIVQLHRLIVYSTSSDVPSLAVTGHYGHSSPAFIPLAGFLILINDDPRPCSAFLNLCPA